MGDFLNSWYGIAIILAFDLVAVLAVICITYRWFFKRVFDVLVSGVCLALTSPLFLAVFIRGKKFQKTHEGGIESLFEKEIRVGTKEKILCLNRFASRDKDGELLGRYVCECIVSNEYKRNDYKKQCPYYMRCCSISLKQRYVLFLKGSGHCSSSSTTSERCSISSEKVE